jgi:hypothetical protein
MDSSAIIAGARRLTGLEHFDSESFRDGLEIVARNLTTSRELTDVGRQTVAGIATNLLANRLRIADYARRHPELRERPIERPLVILGVPRTGTTALSHLLAADPQRRSYLHWEAFDSVPPATQETLTTDPRCLAMKDHDTSSLATPSEIHVLAADLPTECIIAHAHDFKSMLWVGIAEDPVYAEWFLHCDMNSAYAFQRLQLQVLQAHTTGRWVLKAPAHALAIPTLLETFPDAQIVWTHRDPFKAFASGCSISAHSRRSFADSDDAVVARSFLVFFKEHLRRAMAFAEQHPGFIHDLRYTDFVRDPLGEVRRLYAWLGDPFTAQLETRIRDWLIRNQGEKHGQHQYSLERFDQSTEKLGPYFQPYIDRYLR